MMRARSTRPREVKVLNTGGPAPWRAGNFAIQEFQQEDMKLMKQMKNEKD
jgi:hypothetical protein